MSDEDDEPERGGAGFRQRVTAPARSEQAAFRVVLWAAGVAVALAVVVAVARAIS